jgi:hypothetical protein
MFIPTPQVGQRLVGPDGIEYIVNRVRPDTQHYRLQIDAIAVSEAERRRDNLTALLEGEAAGHDGTSVREVI